MDAHLALGERIGGGTFGDVYRATDRSTGEAVAVKVLRRARDYEGLLSFRREIDSAQALDHPVCARILGYGVTEAGAPYLVQELVRGESLSAWMQRSPRASVTRALELLGPVTELLDHAHGRGVTHCDIKPGHILVREVEGGTEVKVIDFGVARLAGPSDDSQNQPAHTSTSGTPGYMAPERILGDRFDGRSDVFSLGVVLYELLSGRFPFELDGIECAEELAAIQTRQRPVPLSEALSHPSATLEGLFVRTLDGDPRKRPTARELRDFLALEAAFERREPRLWSSVGHVPHLPAAEAPAAPRGRVRPTPGDVGRVLESMERCLAAGDLFGRFYQRFTAASPEVRARFASVHLEKQKRVLRFALHLVLLYGEDDPVGRWTLDRIRESHSSRDLDIRPDLYPHWRESLLAVVADMDPQLDAALEADWRRLVDRTIDYITSGY